MRVHFAGPDAGPAEGATELRDALPDAGGIGRAAEVARIELIEQRIETVHEHGVPAGRVEVELSAVAGRDQHGLTEAGLLAKASERPDGLGVPECEPLPGLDRGGMVTDTNDRQRHQRKNPPVEAASRSTTYDATTTVNPTTVARAPLRSCWLPRPRTTNALTKTVHVSIPQIT